MNNYHGLNKKKSFFEGWFFKHQTADKTLSLIPGVNIDGKGNKKAFIQVITDTHSYNIDYPFLEFYVDPKKFFIKIGKNTFGKAGVSIDIEDKSLRLKGQITYGPLTPLKYDIMGPFSVLPFMECNHGVLSLFHKMNGTLTMNDSTLSFENGTGYLETDWGSSFPKTYLWTQCNIFKDNLCSVMLSIADIPFLKQSFRGCIAVIYYQNKEYRLATYKGVKIIKYDAEGILLIQGHYRLEIGFLESSPLPLLAPDKGSMTRTIHENPSCKCRYQFFIKDQLLFDLISDRASLEVVL